MSSVNVEQHCARIALMHQSWLCAKQGLKWKPSSNSVLVLLGPLGGRRRTPARLSGPECWVLVLHRIVSHIRLVHTTLWVDRGIFSLMKCDMGLGE